MEVPVGYWAKGTQEAVAYWRRVDALRREAVRERARAERDRYEVEREAAEVEWSIHVERVLDWTVTSDRSYADTMALAVVGWSRRAIAEAMEITSGLVDRRLSRAVARFERDTGFVWPRSTGRGRRPALLWKPRKVRKPSKRLMRALERASGISQAP